MFASSFLEWTDVGANIFEGRSRDERLVQLYGLYLQWCVDNRSLNENIHLVFELVFFRIVGVLIRPPKMLCVDLVHEKNSEGSRMVAVLGQSFSKLQRYKKAQQPIRL